MGKSIFAESNANQWTPIVSQIAGYYVPGVSFVTIDSCKTGQGEGGLKAFSKALGGVDVRGYEEIQTKSTSEEYDRGAFVTCRVNICRRTEGLLGLPVLLRELELMPLGCSIGVMVMSHSGMGRSSVEPDSIFLFNEN